MWIDGSARLCNVLVQRFEFGRGVELPLLHTVSSTMLCAELHRVHFAPSGVTYDVYYSGNGAHLPVNESLSKMNPLGPRWRGDIIVLRRAPEGSTYVDMTAGDKDLAVRAGIL